MPSSPHPDHVDLIDVAEATYAPVLDAVERHGMGVLPLFNGQHFRAMRSFDAAYWSFVGTLTGRGLNRRDDGDGSDA